jgi:hypothetical protein
MMVTVCSKCTTPKRDPDQDHPGVCICGGFLTDEPAVPPPERREAPPDRGWFERQAKRAQEDIKELPDWLRSSPAAHATQEKRHDETRTAHPLQADLPETEVTPAAHAERPDEQRVQRSIESLVTVWWEAQGCPDVDGKPLSLVKLEKRIADVLRAALSERAPEPIPQEELPADAAKVLRDNLWDLIDGEPTPPPELPSLDFDRVDLGAHTRAFFFRDRDLVLVQQWDRAVWLSSDMWKRITDRVIK